MSIQGELFPETRPPKATQGPAEEQHPILDVLDVPFGEFGGFKSPLVRVKLRAGARFLTPSSTANRHLSSQYTNEYRRAADNLMHWSTDYLMKDNVDEGFIQVITTLLETDEPIIHLCGHVTDLQASSFAVRLDDVEELSVYPENAASVKAMHQNAEIDGSSWNYNRLYGFAVSFTEEDLDAIIKINWPEPELIYSR